MIKVPYKGTFIYLIKPMEINIIPNTIENGAMKEKTPV